MGAHTSIQPATLDRFRFDGRVIFIAGGGGSFGRAAALAFADLGASVFCVDANGAANDETIDLVRATGGRAEGARADTGDVGEVQRAFQRLDATVGTPDVVLNLSGANIPVGRPEDATAEAWAEMVRVNLTAKFLTSQAGARRMIAAGRPGSIVNISSLAGTSVLNRGSLAYGVSMAGVLQLTRELAVAWAPYGIRVNAIQPCQFVNPGLQAMIDDPAQRSTVERIISGIPLGRMGVADEMVGPLVFLASDAAAMVTGVALPVDGGNLAFNAGGTPPSR